ncbi:MAG: substrate-binding domain-containing protein [Acidobacteria bacterium]|nr:substrate-binding domain-containing protein [Acidobacteriota bacterium]
MALTALATMAVDAPLRALTEAFAAQSGHQVNVQVDTSPNIARRLADGQTADILVAQAGLIDQLIVEGRALGDSRAPIGKIGVGVAISRGGTRPDISTPEALKAALLQADAVVCSGGASGVHVERMLRGMGVADRLSATTVYVSSGAAVMERLGASRDNEIGFTMISEVRLGEAHGGSLVGPLPDAFQHYTVYDAVVMSASEAPDTARAFVSLLGSPAARETFAVSGWEF